MNNECLEEFSRFITLCHTVIREKRDREQIIYRGISAEEVALVQSASDSGFQLQKPDFKSATVQEVALYKLLERQLFSFLAGFWRNWKSF